MLSTESLLTAAAVKTFQQNVNRGTNFFSALTDGQLATPVAAGKNRLIYLWGHLIAVNDAMFPLLRIGGRVHPKYETLFLTSPDNYSVPFPNAAELAVAWMEINDKLLLAFEAFTPSEWLERHASVSEEDFAKDTSRNRFAILLSRTGHLAYHLGQAMLAPK